MKNILSLLSAIMITACGGGGSDANLTTATVAEPVSTGSEKQGMAALSVSHEFDFKTDFIVTVNVAENLVNERAFINICAANAVLINLDDCFVRSPLTKNGLEMSFMVPHQEQKMTAKIWFYDTGLEPLSYEWVFNETQEKQLWLIN